MTESDLTIKLLQGIRADLQQANRENADRFTALHQEVTRSRDEANHRFEIIQTTLRDVAEQLVFHSRALKAH